MVYLLKMVIFYSYVSLPEGIKCGSKMLRLFDDLIPVSKTVAPRIAGWKITRVHHQTNDRLTSANQHNEFNPWGSNVGSICWHLRNTLFSDVRRPYLMSVAKFWLHLRETYFPVNLLELKGPCVHQKLQLIIDITLHPNNIYLLPGNLGVHPIPSAADLPAALSHGAPHRHPKLGWRELELVSGSWCCSPSVFFLVVLWYVYVYYIYNWSNGFP